MKGTLAKSNLAYKLLSVGFTDQAKELCENAMAEENYDKRVNSSLEAINEKLEADKKADALILEDTKLTRDFFISFANAIASTSTNIKSGLYKGIECNLEVKCSGNRFTAYGLYETEINAGSLGTGLLNAAFSQNNNKIENHKISYFGEIQGNGVIAKIHRESDKKSGIFSNYNSIKDALIYYSKDEKCFYVQDLNSESTKENPYKIAYIEQLGS
jgi:hypothetical protein